MKINEVILEALNKSTGTPNANPAPPPEAPAADTAQWSGRKKSAPAKTAPAPTQAAPTPAPAPQAAQQQAQSTAPAQQPAPAPTQAATKKVPTAQPTQPDRDPFTDAGAMAKGVGNWIKNRIPGTQANAQRKLDAEDEKANLATAQRYVTNWTNGVKANPKLNTPQDLRKFAQKLATKDGQPLFNPELPKDMSPAGVTQYLKNVVARVTSGLETGVAPTRSTKAKQSTKASNGAFTQMANQLGGTQDNTQVEPQDDNLAGTIPAQANQGNVEQQALAQGVQVKSQEPIIISTGKGKEYGLNDQGQWIHLASGKVPPESFSKFLDQQHDISLNVGQPAQPTTPPAQ